MFFFFSFENFYFLFFIYLFFIYSFIYFYVFVMSCIVFSVQFGMKRDIYKILIYRTVSIM